MALKQDRQRVSLNLSYRRQVHLAVDFIDVVVPSTCGSDATSLPSEVVDDVQEYVGERVIASDAILVNLVGLTCLDVSPDEGCANHIERTLTRVTPTPSDQPLVVGSRDVWRTTIFPCQTRETLTMVKLNGEKSDALHDHHVGVAVENRAGQADLQQSMNDLLRNDRHPW